MSTSNRRTYYVAIVAFWIFGLCNNFTFVIMLSGAMDLMHKASSNATNTSQVAGQLQTKMVQVNCTQQSTGMVLLADVLPGLLFKLAAPVFIQKITFNWKVLVSVSLAMVSVIIVSLSKTSAFILLGVVLTSVSCGLGELTFLSMSASFDRNTISTYSSGTGGAGIVGAWYYALLATYIKPDTIIQITALVPLTCFLVYLFVLPKPDQKNFKWTLLISKNQGDSNRYNENDRLISTAQSDVDASGQINTAVNVDEDEISQVEPNFLMKMKLIKSIFPLLIALGMVYYFEYLINQSLFEFMYFPGSSLMLADQYRWYQVLYQLGVFISRSSVNLVHIRHTWILTVLQAANFGFFLLQVLYPFVPSIWLAFAIVFYEGLLGGLAYVNTFYRISKEAPPRYREFTLATASVADGFGIMLAAFSAILLHNKLCAKITSLY